MRQLIFLLFFLTTHAFGQNIKKQLDSIVHVYLQTGCAGDSYYSRGDISPASNIFQFKKFPITYKLQALSAAEKLNKETDHYRIVFKPAVYREYHLSYLELSSGSSSKASLTKWKGDAAVFYLDVYRLQGAWKVYVEQGRWIFEPVSEKAPGCEEIRDLREKEKNGYFEKMD
jgi:hypothetical protein